MKTRRHRLMSVALALIMICSLLPATIYPASATQSRSDNFSKSYTLTGNGAEDICRIALAQKEKTRSQLGYTEDWCADFVGDCAKLAGQSDAIPACGLVCRGAVGKYDGMNELIQKAGGIVVTKPKRGDIVVDNGWGHIEIVLEVNGDQVTTISGNWSDKVSIPKSHAYTDSWYNVFLRPNYKGSTPTPSQDPGKPALKNMQSSYVVGKDVIFTWDSTTTTTHYNMYYDKKDSAGNWDRIGSNAYVTSGFKRSFEEGNYRVLLQSTNKNAWTDDGSTWRYTNGDWVYFSVVSIDPGKPTLKNMQNSYPVGKDVVFTWDSTATTTHYNMYYDKKDSSGNWNRIGSNAYVTSGFKRSFEEGDYRVLLQSTNKNAWTDDGSTWRYTNGDWVYFSVVSIDPGKPTLKNMQSSYPVGKDVVFTWDDTVNTTHYNLYIDKKDATGNWERIETIPYAEKRMARTFEQGDYRVLIESKNKNYWMDDGSDWRYTHGDWAYFSVLPASFTITFDANGSTSFMTGMTVPAGKSVSLPDNGFIPPDGQCFKAWLINGKEYQPHDKYTFTKDTTVTAVWETVKKPVADDACVSAARTGTSLSVTVTPQNGLTYASGYIAAYDVNGQMLGMAALTPNAGKQTLPLSCDSGKAETVKAFFLDQSARPVADALSGTVQ